MKLSANLLDEKILPIENSLLRGDGVFETVLSIDQSAVAWDRHYARMQKAANKVLISIPAKIGIRNTLRLAFVCHLVMLGFLLGFYWLASPPLSAIYLAGVGFVSCLVLYQHALVNEKDLSRVNQAFFNVNAVISVGLMLIVLLQLYLV